MRVTVIAAMALLGAACWAWRAQAAAARTQQPARAAPQALSMDQAVQMVERRFNARVVRAETRRQDGRTVYVLRLLDRSGRVFTVRVDAATGRIL